ncbi:efflux RND transporter periplasmic adaptor subunit [Psychrosphaera aestuarii]|uniref:efflux RND transporter periplasmic adaptor subunit n=1 Tax=Psychrosphaera aestuarii TaxID=1266052 RepID=UPI001B33B5A2|nr:efflux RND transporter periplasmic adaptor subunit [Psychrosphaera aestuarii]
MSYSKLFNTISLVAIISSQLVLSGCTKEEKDLEAPSNIVRPAKLAQVKQVSGDTIRTFPATVEPSTYAHLAFRVNGEIAEIKVVAGQNVKKDDVLAVLDDSDFIIQHKQAQARFKLTSSQFERANKLLKEKLISSAEYDQIKAELDIASAQLDAAKNNLKYSVIKAPFSGIVAHTNVEAFEFVQAKQPIMELQGRETIDVVIQVPEQLMIKLPKSTKAQTYQPTLIFDGNQQNKYKVTLKEHDIIPNPATKSYQVVFSLPTPEDINVLPGMTGALEVELDKLLASDINALIVPISAVFVPNSKVQDSQATNTQFVMKVRKDMSTELVAVEVVETRQSGMVIKALEAGKLISGDKVIAAGPHLLVEGQSVSEWKQERGL